MESNKYIEKWLNNSLSEEERHVFEKTDDFQSIIRIEKVIRNFAAPEFDVEAELSKLNENKNNEAKVIKMAWFQPLVRVAALVVMVILAYMLYIQPKATVIKSGIAQQAEITLPDNSEVILNASSSMSYVEDEWQNNRELTLRGEAYFNVAKGARFEVKTSSGIVTVLGTQFNIKVRDNYFEVMCYEGLVGIISGDSDLKLRPGNMFRVLNGEISEIDNLKDSMPSWMANESSFISVPYLQVIKEFERQYDVIITTNGVDLDQIFTGRFSHSDITLALKSIALPFNLSYDFKEDKQHILLSIGSE